MRLAENVSNKNTRWPKFVLQRKEVKCESAKAIVRSSMQQPGGAAFNLFLLTNKSMKLKQI
jgi:hypothetical protein